MSQWTIRSVCSTTGNPGRPAEEFTFKVGGQEAYTVARANLKRGIEAAKDDSTNQLDSNTRQV